MAICTFPEWPASLIASMSACRPSSLSWMFGAKPPSSPTAAASLPYLPLTTSLREWYTSAPICSASLKELAPVGAIMNSCMGSLLPACSPPLITFIMGTGILYCLVRARDLSTSTGSKFPSFSSPMYSYSSSPYAAAPARAMHMETASTALAPSLALGKPHSFSEPSSFRIMKSSSSFWRRESLPFSFGAIRRLMLETALATPLPL
mmetsp:Transcript_70898/g.161041  ORF Transcript_70898/g.161041 Transcript_70898/m.161041 type:complete len:206 (+) Transcript_70898:695-1312(+)